MRRACTVLALLGPLTALVACGGSGPSGATTVVRKVVVEERVQPAHHRPPPGPTATTSGPTSASCDSNITVEAETTSCPFAENVFYEYWKSGRATSFTAYSPTTGSSFTLQCTNGEEVECDTTAGAVVRFSAAAADAYGPAQADRYARTHDTGSPAPARDSGSGGTGDPSETTAGFCSTHACIPSFADGRGYIVQCGDGEWSHSGGISGACSSHAGETDRAYP